MIRAQAMHRAVTARLILGRCALTGQSWHDTGERVVRLANSTHWRQHAPTRLDA